MKCSSTAGLRARAFDFRAKVNHGKLTFHHGAIGINHEVSDGLQEIVSWANQHPSVEDLVLIYVSHCEGHGCDDAVADALAKANITRIADCSQVMSLSVGEAAEKGRLKGGGSVLALDGCVDENYNSTLACSGFDGLKAYQCWKTSSTRDIPFQRLIKSLEQFASASPDSFSNLQMLQAHWQETADAIVIGEAHFSSIIKDEERSGLNRFMAQAIHNGTFSHINLFEVDNVCDGGQDLLQALRARQKSKLNEVHSKGSSIFI